jgi:hypothetical protein
LTQTFALECEQEIYAPDLAESFRFLIFKIDEMKIYRGGAGYELKVMEKLKKRPSNIRSRGMRDYGRGRHLRSHNIPHDYHCKIITSEILQRQIRTRGAVKYTRALLYMLTEDG